MNQSMIRYLLRINECFLPQHLSQHRFTTVCKDEISGRAEINCHGIQVNSLVIFAYGEGGICICDTNSTAFFLEH